MTCGVRNVGTISPPTPPTHSAGTPAPEPMPRVGSRTGQQPRRHPAPRKQTRHTDPRPRSGVGTAERPPEWSPRGRRHGPPAPPPSGCPPAGSSVDPPWPWSEFCQQPERPMSPLGSHQLQRRQLRPSRRDRPCPRNHGHSDVRRHQSRITQLSPVVLLRTWQALNDFQAVFRPEAGCQKRPQIWRNPNNTSNTTRPIAATGAATDPNGYEPQRTTTPTSAQLSGLF